MFLCCSINSTMTLLTHSNGQQQRGHDVNPNKEEHVRREAPWQEPTASAAQKATRPYIIKVGQKKRAKQHPSPPLLLAPARADGKAEFRPTNHADGLDLDAGEDANGQSSPHAPRVRA